LAQSHLHNATIHDSHWQVMDLNIGPLGFDVEIISLLDFMLLEPINISVFEQNLPSQLLVFSVMLQNLTSLADASACNLCYLPKLSLAATANLAAHNTLGLFSITVTVKRVS
jgi:hypothetical protein